MRINVFKVAKVGDSIRKNSLEAPSFSPQVFLWERLFRCSRVIAGKEVIIIIWPVRPHACFRCKTIEKIEYEGRTRWCEQGRKKPSGPAGIVYGPHAGITRKMWTKKNFPNLNISNLIYWKKKKKKEKRGGLIIKWLLTEWEGRTGKYLANIWKIFGQLFSRPALPLSQ